MTEPEPTEQAETSQRPELHVVRGTEPDTDPAEAVTDADADVDVEGTAESPGETTGSLPVLDADGNPVSGKAPLDVRVRDALLRGVYGIPAFGQVPASFADSIAYSQHGDWATSDNGLARVTHGLSTVLAYVATYPLVEGLGKAREKPIGFVLVLAALYALYRILT